MIKRIGKHGCRQRSANGENRTVQFFDGCLLVHRHQALYLFGAVCPARDEAVALVLPDVSTAAMQAMLDELSKAVELDAHAVVIMDRAGWHCAKVLIVPNNLSLAFLPPCSPELNVIERVWLYLKERYLSLLISDRRASFMPAADLQPGLLTGCLSGRA